MPEHAAVLIQSGHTVSVERSPERCVPDEEYEKVGCTMVETTWPQAPKDMIILGLKELPESDDPLTHRHVFFGHCYKNQKGWQDFLKRFLAGHGLLLDLEFLVDDNGRRVAAFGRSAGFIGMAAGLKAWTQQQRDGEKLAKLDYYQDSPTLVNEIRDELESVFSKTSRKPRVLVMGALGRCGRGAVDFAKRAGLEQSQIICWDLEETRMGGPFPQILDVDIFVNCIYLSQPIAPFLTKQMLAEAKNRALSVVVDVSCDTFNPHNPIPLYDQNTTFASPCLRILQTPTPLDIISIDHLPSLVPVESSSEFSEAIVSHLKDCGKTTVWQRAEQLFNDKCIGL